MDLLFRENEYTRTLSCDGLSLSTGRNDGCCYIISNTSQLISMKYSEDEHVMSAPAATV
jgi:hypothetical protein